MSDETKKSDLTERTLNDVVGGNSNQNNPLHSAATKAVTELSVDELEQVAGGFTIKSTRPVLIKASSASSGALD